MGTEWLRLMSFVFLIFAYNGMSPSISYSSAAILLWWHFINYFFSQLIRPWWSLCCSGSPCVVCLLLASTPCLSYFVHQSILFNWWWSLLTCTSWLDPHYHAVEGTPEFHSDGHSLIGFNWWWASTAPKKPNDISMSTYQYKVSLARSVQHLIFLL